ncbi:DoxX [Mariniflexile rhizosphaerae]|uniref:DoxX family protein n=1 Tax=unclassified Mariniflexile TaxID=2643887 RepID=UPI000CB83F03|nr:DoxX family protein [Mariniflexile sp. TRM1-10]AXP82642.1 DoxX [Mariniflexile sp. TRM1-10]PLB18264.1 MAG: DoxX family protein [Flavobacteriaceae bacterium FS1-H7996/R]
MNKNVTDLGLLILRIGFAGMLLTHGIPKINLLFESPIKFADPIGVGETTTLILALIGEVVAPILILIGFKTKLATIPSIITMFVAVFVIHASDPMDVKEKAILYLVAFLVIFLTGAGKYSIDGYKK